MVNYAIIAGNDNLPILVQQELINKGNKVFIIGFGTQTHPDLQQDISTSLAKVGQILEFLAKNNVQKVIFAGRIERPDLKQLTPDKEGAKLLAKIMAKSIFGKGLGDDKLLTTISNYLEAKGYEVVAPSQVLNNNLPAGCITKTKPSKQQLADIKLGQEILNSLSKYDIGQSIIIADGYIAGIEAAEGTDGLIKRCGSYNKPGGVLVKLPKLGQSNKMDVPTIGVQTIDNIIVNKLSGLAIMQDGINIIDKDSVIKALNKAGLFLYILSE